MGDDATRRRAAWLVATPLLLVAACVCAPMGDLPSSADQAAPKGPPAALVPQGGRLLAPSSLAIVRGTREITDRAAEATDQALRRDGCLELVTQRALLHRWPGYPQDLPIPAHGKYRPVVEIDPPIPQSPGRSPRAPARATWR